ncbi:MAG: betaine--homocysteine S-methyltransferase [Alphaproteobacteria bacterium]|nr:betaine--homocysteine S-methyltransferase [Alphaproteobacteria bacterium]MDX5368509.1 betaine--homocysteine S-methyltransferase [Alphaproteobacteria bacterium]MDX5463273.1 betaine--homocysteine S-methyltransferase [Alphaproteobacteria bacterium]
MTSLLQTLLDERPWLLADGATGTNFFAMGLESGDPPEFWNIDHPDRVEALHRSFVEAGADIILTNSFGANRHRLKLHQAQARVHELNAAAAQIARKVADAAGRPVVVAGSMGPTGELLEPVGALAYADAVETFAEQAEGLKAGGADALWIETMSAENEVRAAIEGASRTGLPIVATMSFDTAGRTMMGITPAALGELSGHLHPEPCAIGANCGVGASELVCTVLGISGARPEAVVVAKANCGVPKFVDGEIAYTGTPELMADYARLALDAGARIIGGCCGTKPEHLKAMRAALEGYTPGARPTPEEVEARLGEISELARAGGVAPAGGDDEARAGRRRGRRRA